MKPFKFIAVALVAMIFAGCCYCKQYERKYGRPFHDTRWTLAQVDGRNVETDCVAVFSANYGLSVTGDAQITASYSYNEQGRMQISDVKTEQASDGEAADRFAQALRQTTGFKQNGPFLMLMRDGEMWALFEAKDPKPGKGRR